jgi:hypothetical protein
MRRARAGAFLGALGLAAVAGSGQRRGLGASAVKRRGRGRSAAPAAGTEALMSSSFSFVVVRRVGQLGITKRGYCIVERRDRIDQVQFERLAGAVAFGLGRQHLSTLMPRLRATSAQNSRAARRTRPASAP